LSAYYQLKSKLNQGSVVGGWLVGAASHHAVLCSNIHDGSCHVIDCNAVHFILLSRYSMNSLPSLVLPLCFVAVLGSVSISIAHILVLVLS
jgi:hypothetical protein